MLKIAWQKNQHRMNYKRIRFSPYGKGDSESTKMMIKEENNESFIFYKDSLQEIL